MYALIDGNNFYCSCERVFQPALRGRPLIVLSNNDGCAIARSNEAKALGIPMGAPWHEIRHLEKRAGLFALSANFPLYGDLSTRMHSITARLGPEQEIYSIDESFVNLDGVHDRCKRVWRAREQILDWIGIPTCIGIGPTKTLAKLANHIAKTAERKPGSYPAELAGVCDLSSLSPQTLDDVLEATALEEIWGIGPRIAKQMRELGLTTCLDVARIDPSTARRRWSVTLERTVREIQGQRCIELEEAPPPRQEIARTRSFGHPIGLMTDLAEAITEFATRAAEVLRGQDSLCNQVHVFIQTSPFRTNQPQFAKGITITLGQATCDSRVIVDAALKGLTSIYRPGFLFAKAGVLLMELSSAGNAQGQLNFDAPSGDKGKLMTTLDTLNRRFGPGAVRLAGAGSAHTPKMWTMRQERRTPHYTTSWKDILTLTL